MADTFSSVASNAEAEYQMQFARIVKEQVETTVLCVPLNVPEYIINWVAGDRGRGPDSSRSGNALQWGTPLPPLIARRSRDSSVPHSQGGTTHGLHRSFHSS